MTCKRGQHDSNAFILYYSSAQHSPRQEGLRPWETATVAAAAAVAEMHADRLGMIVGSS